MGSYIDAQSYEIQRLLADIRRQFERDLFADGAKSPSSPPPKKTAQDRYREWADEFNYDEDY